MKFLRHNYQNFESKHNWCWIDNDVAEQEVGNWKDNELIKNDLKRNELSPEAKTERIIELVKSPIEFSFRDIKFIEKNKELVKHNKDFQYGFRKIAEYYLSLAVVKSSVMPSRILYSIGLSSLSNDFLPPKIKKGIELVIDNNLNKVSDLIVIDSGEWSNGQTAQAVALYKALKSKNKKAGNKKINEVFKSISKKLVERAIDIANSNEKLTTSQRLLIWEIKRQIPESFRTSSEISNLLGNVSQENANDLLQTILNGKEKNSPNLILLWDILEDLAYQNDISVNEDDRKKLRNFILRGNATHLLESINKSDPKILLPIHLKALNDLNSPNFKELWKATENHFDINEIDISEEAIANQKDQKKYKAQIRELEKQKQIIEDQELEELIANEKIKNQEQINEYQSQKESLESLLNNETIGTSDKTITNIAQDLKNLFKKEGRGKIGRSFEDVLTDLTTQASSKDKIQALSNLIEKLETMRRDGWNNILSQEEEKQKKEHFDKKTQKTLEEIRDAVSNQTATDSTQESDGISDFLFNEEQQNKLNNLLQILKTGKIKEKSEKKLEKFNEIKRELKDSISSEESDKINVLNKKLTELRNSQAGEDIKREIEDEIFEIYKDPDSTREEILESYETSLKQRIANHRLHAADFQVLMDPARQGAESSEHENINHFRDEFEKVLNNIDVSLSGITTAIGNLDLDNPNTDELVPYLSKIEKQIGIASFRESLAKELNLFESPQIKDEIIKGAMGYFHKQINEKIESAIGGLAPSSNAYRSQQDFFLNQVRTHTNINTTTEIKALNGAYNQYFVKKVSLDQKTEVERNKLEGAIEDLDELDKEKIRGAYNSGVDYLQKGYKNNDFQFPGTQKLNEATLQSKPLLIELTTLFSTPNEKLEQLLSTISNEKTDQIDIEISFKDFYNSWSKEGKIDLDEKIESFKNLCKKTIFNEEDENGNLIHKQFLDKYFETIDKAISNIEEGIAELKTTIESRENLTGNEQIWGKIQTDFSNLKSWFSFDEGKFAEHKNNIENRLFDHKSDKNENINGFSETVQDLKSLGIFEDRKTAQDNFNKTRADFSAKAKRFDDSIYKVKARIELDRNKLNDDKFEEKYGMHKDEAKTTLGHFNTYKGDFDDQWKKFDNPKYFDEWWEQYQKGDESRFTAIREFQDIERLGHTANKMGNKVEEFDKWLDDWSEYGETQRKNKWYNRVTMGDSFSLYSVYLLIKQNMEIVETRWKRNQDRMAYNLGQQIYGDSAWGKEFRRMSEDSENERVKQWESNYASLDVWDTAEYLYKTNDPDEAKACITILNNKGYLKWDNPRLWKTLMRLQNNVIFNIPEDMNLEIKDITRKVSDACEIIWSKDDFNTWDTSIDDNMKKAKAGYEQEFRNLTDSQVDGQSMLALELSGMLEKWSKGDTKDVYPDKFYSFLHLAFEQGKLNGQPDKRWYYLIKGVTTKNPQGESLLPKSVFQKFNVDLLASMPYFDFFIDKTSWKKNGQIVPKDTDGARQGIWLYEDYLAWGEMMGDGGGDFFPRKDSTLEKNIEHFFYDVIDMSDDARGRVSRMGRGTNTNADHDDGETFFTGLEEEQVLQLLSSRSEGTQQVTNDFWRAYLSGFDRFMKNRKRLIKERDLEYGLTDPSWAKMRKKILYDVGVKLKTASTVIQVLSGNLDSPNQTPLIFNEKHWDKEIGQTTIKKAQESKNEINNMVFDLLETVNDTKGYKKNLEQNLYLKTTNVKTLRLNPDWKSTNEKNNEFFSDNGGGKYFKDTTALWDVLKNYGE